MCIHVYACVCMHVLTVVTPSRILCFHMHVSPVHPSPQSISLGVEGVGGGKCLGI